jgi:hypothetical protein
LIIDIEVMNRKLDLAINLLRRTYTPTKVGGGWYHQLDMDPPDPTATGVALTAFHEANQRFEHFAEALSFLKSRQIIMPHSDVAGGWAMNTSFGLPVVEATGWVARFLGLARCGYIDGGPDVAGAYRWLLCNQNDDGGWGSMRGCPSRTWLTCLALRALAQLDPHAPAIGRGVDWLLSRQDRVSCGWGTGVSAAGPPTVTHTGFVLLTLSELHIDRAQEHILSAYTWLENNLDPSAIDDAQARIESYNVNQTLDGKPVVWHTILVHYGLPVALSALLRHPICPPSAPICAGFATIAATQLDDGSWPNIQGGQGASIWALWPFVQALTDICRLPLIRPADQLVLSPGLVAIQRQEVRGRPLTSLLRTQRWLAVARFFARFWASLLLILSVVTGLLLVGAGRFGWKDFLLGLILPIGLMVLQELRQRHGKR